MAESMLVSIVTPSFNQGAFIGETISSVLGQNYPFIEYLVVDGGSTDSTLDAVRSFGDRLKWISEPDRGQSDAINKGWRRTRGEIIAWLNADDLYRPGALDRVVRFFREHPRVDLVYGDCEYINERGDIIGRHPARHVSGEELLRSSKSIIPQPATFLRRRVLATVGYLDQALHYVMDLEYWIRVAIRHQIAYLPECLAAFRFHGHSKSMSQYAPMQAEQLRVRERFFKSGDLPDHFRRVEREAMSNAYTRAAHEHLLLGDKGRARAYALAGWRYLPWRPRRMQLRVLALSLIRTHGTQTASGVTET